MTTDRKEIPFNSALETGVRTLTILAASYPNNHDLGRLVKYDYLTVHSADAGGPPSLHPPLPHRSGELLVRRGLIESGLQLMMSRSLVKRIIDNQGIHYVAAEAAGSFLDNMRSQYTADLRIRAQWVTTYFQELNDSALDMVIKQLFDTWTTEFQPIQYGTQAEISL